MAPNSNFDTFCLRTFFLSLKEMAAAADRPADAATWSALAGALGGYHVDAGGALMLDETRDLTASHRHFSHIMGIHPFNLITTDGGDRDRRIINASLRHMDQLGTKTWVGFSFAWMACLRARVGQPEAALRNLNLFTSAFVLRNGFHANGDQTRSGLSDWTYRPFTLEGNFVAMQTVHEMLLQSWAPSLGSGEAGVIRIFPAMPWRWHEASFDDLRAEGGHRVSARRENNATTWFRVVAGRDGPMRIRDNFGGRAPAWNRAGVTRDGEDFRVELPKGQAIEATLPIPGGIPHAPADAAEPVHLSRAAPE
jgi:alpha-L-fucosidase 2